MATLVRTQTAPAAASSSDPTRIGNSSQQYWNDLHRSIPAPFHTAAQREQEELLQELAAEPVHLEQTTRHASQVTSSASAAVHGVPTSVVVSSQEMTQTKGPSVMGEVRSDDCLSVSLSLTSLNAVAG